MIRIEKGLFIELAYYIYPREYSEEDIIIASNIRRAFIWNWDEILWITSGCGSA